MDSGHLGRGQRNWAVDSGNWLLVAWMIDHDADLSATDYNGWTPLLRLCKMNTGQLFTTRS